MSAGPVSWTTTHGDKVEVWSQPQGVWWFWHRTARNGKVIADSSEGYTKRPHCLRMAERINPRVEQAAVPVYCRKHRPVQHRDARPPWCHLCGLTADYWDPGPKLSERINPKVET